LKRHLPLVAILALAFVSRAAVLWLGGPIVVPDTPQYIGAARTLAATGSYADPAPDGHLVPHAFRVPGYSVLLAALVRWSPGSLEVAASWANVALALVSLALTWAIALEVASRRTAIAATTLSALSPCALLYGTAVLSDQLFTTFSLALVLAGLRCLRAPSPARALTWGAIAGAGTLVRPLLKFYAPLFFAALACARLPPRRVLSLGLFACALWALPLAAWTLRNQQALGFPGLELTSGVNTLVSMMDQVRPPTPDEISADPQLAEVRRIASRSKGHLEALTRVQSELHLPLKEADGQLFRLGAAVIREHPVIFARRWLFNTLNFFISPSAVQSLLVHIGAAGPSIERPLSQAGALAVATNLGTRAVSAILFLALAPLGALRLARHPEHRAAVAYIALHVAYNAALNSVVTGLDRYRLPVEPLLFVLACALLPAKEIRGRDPQSGQHAGSERPGSDT